jgi:hypothetical protein
MVGGWPDDLVCPSASTVRYGGKVACKAESCGQIWWESGLQSWFLWSDMVGEWPAKSKLQHDEYLQTQWQS